MTSFWTIAVVISVIGINISGIIAAPVITTHDESQYGDLNVAAKLENFFILIALPSKTPSLTIDDSSELANYLSLLGDRGHSTPAHNYETNPETGNADSNEPTKLGDKNDNRNDDEDDGEMFSDEDESKEVSTRPDKASDIDKTVKLDEAKVPKGRNLWGQVEDVVDNRQGGSLKKELSWGQNIGDGTSRSSDHNDVGLTPNRHLTLLGPGIEDCGPDRHRNSYGICTSLPSE